jgi:hypothetical protein
MPKKSSTEKATRKKKKRGKVNSPETHKMICIIDSGSTKADWVFSDGKREINFTTPGMNPFFIKEPEIVSLIKKNIKGIQFEFVSKVYFFGAGCSEKKLEKIIERAFQRVFTRAKIYAQHDMLGAVLATCGDKKGICCILGTGSNSVYFDGKKLQKNNYGMGFILGDEGSGTYLGKKLITHYLYNILPPGLSGKFRRKYKLSRQDVITKVYGNPQANRWLASFVPFLYDHRDNFWVRNVVRQGFEEFVTLFVLNYRNHKKLPVHFVGSISFLFRDLLIEVLDSNNLTAGKFIRKPIEGLTHYYLKKEFEK